MRLGFGILRLAVLALLLGSLATAAAQMTWHAMGESDVLPPRPALAAPTAVSTEPPDTSAIIALAPFGRVEAPVLVQTETRKTSLNLILRGVVLDDDPARSVAFIASETVTAGYRSGDSVDRKATLLSVEATHVLLDVNGTQEILAFPDPDAPANPNRELTGLERLSLATESANPADSAEPKTTDDYVNYWRDRIRANPGEVLAEIGLVATEGGYRIADRHDSGVRKAGLRAGDVVTRVNGQQVGDVEQDKKLYDEIAASGQARIEVARGDRTIVMTFPLR